jgi:hypothetical protein
MNGSAQADQVEVLGKVACSAKDKDAAGLGTLAYALAEGKPNVLVGAEEDRDVRIVSEGIRRPAEFWAWAEGSASCDDKCDNRFSNTESRARRVCYFEAGPCTPHLRRPARSVPAGCAWGRRIDCWWELASSGPQRPRDARDLACDHYRGSARQRGGSCLRLGARQWLMR